MALTAPITLRWRIHDGKLPLRQRHMRALSRLDLPDALMAWVHERLEWAMINMLTSGSEAVLVLGIDSATEVQLSLEDIRKKPILESADLMVHGDTVTGVYSDGQPIAGDIWIEQNGVLVSCVSDVFTATSTLCRDLATTLGFEVEIGQQPFPVVQKAAGRGQAFVVSDEFGFLPISSQGKGATEAEGTITKRMREAFEKLW